MWGWGARASFFWECVYLRHVHSQCVWRTSRLLGICWSFQSPCNILFFIFFLPLVSLLLSPTVIHCSDGCDACNFLTMHQEKAFKFLYGQLPQIFSNLCSIVSCRKSSEDPTVIHWEQNFEEPFSSVCDKFALALSFLQIYGVI